MRNFFQRIAIFMQGRYGMDTMNKVLLGAVIFLWLVNIFVFNRTAHFVIYLAELALLGYVLFRALSRNIVGRSSENRGFEKLYNPIKNWVLFTFKKIKDRKDFRYVKCPMCKAQLRVKNSKGIHTVRCPRCGSQFEMKI